MGFLQPLALFGLAAAAIPALLHLMTRRQPPEVPFPAVRYIQETERVHSKRLKLRNLLLLVLRTLLIVLVILAASRPVLNLGAGSSHPPTAVGLVIDNSMSSGLVIEGRSVLDMMREEARSVLRGLGNDDRLWLVTVDGVPQALGRVEAAEIIDTLGTSWARMDIGEAVRAVAGAIDRAQMPNSEVVVLSDLQRTALTSGQAVSARVVFWQSPVPPDNHGIDSVTTEGATLRTGGSVAAWIGGSGADPIAARLSIDGRQIDRAVVRAGEQLVMHGTTGRGASGWSVAHLALDPDELRADDTRHVAVLEAPPAAIDVTASMGQFLDLSLAVLREAGRITTGSEVVIGVLAGSGTSLVFPPEDPVLVGATNRSLERAGSNLRFGDRVDGEWLLEGDLTQLRDITVRKRHRVIGDGEVLARAGSEPWLIKDGNIIVVASRAAPQWSDLPLKADFIPFVDFLINSLASGGARQVAVTPGNTFQVPPGAAALRSDSVHLDVQPDSRSLAPLVPGVYFMTGDQGDTLGAVTVTHDPRESRLEQASLSMLAASFGADIVAPTSDLGPVLFNGGGRIDLTTVLIALALVTALVELWVATGRGAGGKERGAR